MELTYDNIVKWMKDYFPVYSEYGQNPATAHRMKDYYASDFEFIGYIGAPEGPLIIKSCDDFLRFDLSHPSSYERLTPEDMTVDERRHVVVVIIKFEAIDIKTKEVLVTERGISHYQLALDENNTFKIKRLLFFPEHLPAGTLRVSDIFARDWK
jgi:hypothetical protein